MRMFQMVNAPHYKPTWERDIGSARQTAGFGWKSTETSLIRFLMPHCCRHLRNDHLLSVGEIAKKKNWIRLGRDFFLFLIFLTGLASARLSSLTSTHTYGNKLNAEADTRVQPFSIKPDIKQICKKKKSETMPFFSLNFGLGLVL